MGIRGTIRTDAEAFGDLLSAQNKAHNVVRFLHHNLSNLPKHARPAANSDVIDKNKAFCQEISDTNADIIGFSEHGLNPRKLPMEDQWRERDTGRLPRKHVAILSCNTTEPNDQQEWKQWGGTGMIAMPSVAPKMHDKGKDPTGLGRWTWI